VPGLTIDESARLLGHLRWLEERLFEVLGGWVRTTADPDTKLLLARHSAHHAWHAELLAKCLPDTRDHDPAALTAPAGAEWATLVDELRALDTDPARVVAVYEVVQPALIRSYEGFLAGASPVRDAAGIRWVGIVLTDERADLVEASGALTAVAGEPGASAGRGLQWHLPPS
jgi:hypothetical protein